MERSWMKKARREIAYEDGVEEFLAFSYRDLPHDSEILCPCKNCKNRINQSRDEVRTHLSTRSPGWRESDSMQELLHAAFGRAAGMPRGEADDFQSGFSDMEHNALEDIVNSAQGDDSGRDQNIDARFLKDANVRLYPGCKYSRLSFLGFFYF
uniref:Transposase-associated domain-containing protein n=1 Tax=Setaria italica TaxID=4555 RepID=K3ZC47_SETIT